MGATSSNSKRCQKRGVQNAPKIPKPRWSVWRRNGSKSSAPLPLNDEVEYSLSLVCFSGAGDTLGSNVSSAYSLKRNERPILAHYYWKSVEDAHIRKCIPTSIDCYVTRGICDQQPGIVIYMITGYTITPAHVLMRAVDCSEG